MLERIRLKFYKLLTDPRGNVLIVAAFGMPLAVGGAGLATDTVQWALTKRLLQQQADAGAMSGAFARAQNADVRVAVNSDLSATTKVILLDVPVIENAPSVGTYIGDTTAVRVALRAQKRLPFSGMFIAAPVIAVEATSKIVSSGQYCVIALDATSTTGINFAGNATLDLGCGIAANSKGSSAIQAYGSSYINVTTANAVGSIPASGSYVPTAKIFSHSVPQTDPFASIPDPTVSNCAATLTVKPNQTRSASPGCFRGMDIKGTVNFSPGVYYIDGSGGGTFNIDSQATLNGSDVTFVMTSSSAAWYPASISTISINGGATLNLSASTTGPYAGVLFYQDRRALDNNTNLINGNAVSVLQGAIYVPSQALTYSGTSGMQTQCLQLVAKRVSFSGNSSINNTCPPASGAHSFLGTIVRLVG